jgi:hypothetical protein
MNDGNSLGFGLLLLMFYCIITPRLNKIKFPETNYVV